MASSSFSTSGTAVISGTTATNLILSSPTISVASSTNGDMWYQASGTVARLAKGTGDFKLFMNTGATAPEWAVGNKTITTTYNLATASGDQAITGVGFKASSMYLFALEASSQLPQWGWADAAKGMGCIYIPTSGTWASSAASLMNHTEGGGSATAILKSWDADGFTLTWTKTSSPAGTLTMYFICYR